MTSCRPNPLDVQIDSNGDLVPTNSNDRADALAYTLAWLNRKLASASAMPLRVLDPERWLAHRREQREQREKRRRRRARRKRRGF